LLLVSGGLAAFRAAQAGNVAQVIPARRATALRSFPIADEEVDEEPQRERAEKDRRPIPDGVLRIEHMPMVTMKPTFLRAWASKMQQNWSSRYASSGNVSRTTFTRSFTWLIDSLISFFSPASMSISMTFSMPPEPRMQGTPTK